MLQQPLKPSMQNSPPSRRSFLATLAWIFSGLIGLVMGITGSLYAIYPAFWGKRSREEAWNTVVSLEQIPQAQPTKYVMNLSERAGWAESNIQQAVWVIRSGKNIDVFSAVCPHEGCTISYTPKNFVCRCHNSQWQENGEKMLGPTPRGMDKLEHRITDDNRLEVKYESFKRGTTEKTPVV